MSETLAYEHANVEFSCCGDGSVDECPCSFKYVLIRCKVCVLNDARLWAAQMVVANLMREVSRHPGSMRKTYGDADSVIAMLDNPLPVTVLNPATPMLFENFACVCATCHLKITVSIRIAERMRSDPFLEYKPDNCLDHSLLIRNARSLTMNLHGVNQYE